MNTYNKIKKNFHNMFRRLFGGGAAQLHLQDGNHVLESGITKVLSVRIENEDAAADTGFPGEIFEEEEVEAEEGRELPIGVDDPALVSDAELRPIRAGRSSGSEA
jgi:hypothetical protein